VGTECSWDGVACDATGEHVVTLDLSSNNLVGQIPSELGNLANLQILYLYTNQLSGSIPPELGNLTKLLQLYLHHNQLTGSIPPELGNITFLHQLLLSDNQLTGPIPPELGSLTNLANFRLAINQLSGPVPSWLGNLTNLTVLDLRDNQLSGPIPPELGNLTKLMYLWLYGNQLSGPIPAELGNLTNLLHLYLHNNQLTGPIPAELGNLSSLIKLNLGVNQLGGDPLTVDVPAELGNLANLEELYLHENKLTGDMPTTLQNLTSLVAGKLQLRYNALYASDTALNEFLDSKQADWETTQTIAPAGLAAGAPTPTSVPLSWSKILYSTHQGGYEVYYSTAADGPYTLFGTTADKTVESITVTGLVDAQTYFFRLRTRTEPHVLNENIVLSEWSDVISATTPLDTDGDGIPDEVDNCPSTANPDQADFDDDGLGDACDPDDDNDCLPDIKDPCPLDDDCDDDGLTDGGCGSEDLNNNGIVDPGETDPMNPDTDGDGILDGTEAGLETPEGSNTDEQVFVPDLDPITTTDPLDSDTDDDGILDGNEDVNTDGRADPEECDPNNVDTDGDGILDGTEAGLETPEGSHTDPSVFVRDEDPTTTTDPMDPDTDDDGLSDGDEDSNHDGKCDEGETSPSTYTVEIDIKPGSFPNCFNNDGKGVIPVAVLGASDFDVANINPASVMLKALPIKAVGKSDTLLAHYEDVNGDGYADLVAQIEDMDGIFAEGDSMATLSGQLNDGTPFDGVDSICIVP
jgi:Leucine-rich repeat (LRR) protein